MSITLSFLFYLLFSIEARFKQNRIAIEKSTNKKQNPTNSFCYKSLKEIISSLEKKIKELEEDVEKLKKESQTLEIKQEISTREKKYKKFEPV